MSLIFTSFLLMAFGYSKFSTSLTIDMWLSFCFGGTILELLSDSYLPEKNIMEIIKKLKDSMFKIRVYFLEAQNRNKTYLFKKIKNISNWIINNRDKQK